MSRFDPGRPVTLTLHTLVARPTDDRCPSRYATVIFYPTVEQMRAAAAAYNARRGYGPVPPNFLAVVQTQPLRERYDGKTKTWSDTTGRHIGVVRFAADWLTPEVIAHESLHLALALERMHQWQLSLEGDEDAKVLVDNGTGIDLDNEEDVALHAGQITHYLTHEVRSLVADGWAPEPHWATSTNDPRWGQHGARG